MTDATGGVLPGAVVAVEGPQERRDTVTDGAGFYRISYLPAGPYTVTVSLDGFQPAELEVTVALDRTLTANATLNVGQAERLVVRPDEWALDISRSSLSRVVSPEVIDIMPVNNRNYLDLIRLTPGVVNNAGAGAAAPSSLDTSGAILGERAGNASFLLDGLWNNNAFGGGVLQNLTQDTVEQFEVIATGYAAEFGQGSGGVINVITKSGTNTMSGSGFSFIRNDAMDAANVDGEDAPDLTRYNVGFTVGGPIRENRDWFFGSLEFVSEDRQSLFPQDIPPALAAQEDFSRQPELRDNRVLRDEHGKYTRDLGFGDRLHAFASWEQLDQRNQLRSGSGGLPSSGQDTDDTSFLTGATLISPLSSSTVFEAQLGVRGQSFDGRGSLGESRSFSAFFFDTGSSFTFGPPIGSVRSLDQRYYTARASLTHFTGATHTLKGGAELTRTTVDGQNQPGLTSRAADLDGQLRTVRDRRLSATPGSRVRGARGSAHASAEHRRLALPAGRLAAAADRHGESRGSLRGRFQVRRYEQRRPPSGDRLGRRPEDDRSCELGHVLRPLPAWHRRWHPGAGWL